jgi:hypothetical protein
MNDHSTPLKFKVVMGSGPSETIKRLSKTPDNFIDLLAMIMKRLSDRLVDEEEIYIYYEDISNGMIRIEDDTDLKGAVDHCSLYSRKSLKLHGKFAFKSLYHLINHFFEIPNLSFYSSFVSSRFQYQQNEKRLRSH